MSLRTFIKLCAQALRFTIKRPIQRFNVQNRSKKYLGPDAELFMPAPRAIGRMYLNQGKPIQYPHLEAGKGFKSVRARRLEAIEKKNDSGGGGGEPMQSIVPPITPPIVDPNVFMPRSFSRTEKDDSLVREAANKLEVTKKVIRLEINEGRDRKMVEIEEGEKEIGNTDGEIVAQEGSRPLPKCTNLDLADPADIWIAKKTPPGRINLDMLQEMMINKLADDQYWTPKVVADRYQIKEEYAESLLKYLKQIRVIVSPRVARALDYTGLNNPAYQATKHIVYHVDKSLRNDIDKQFDNMYLPTDQPGEEIKSLIEPSSIIELEPGNREAKLVGAKPKVKKTPKPLQISPLNRPKTKELDGAPSQYKPAIQLMDSIELSKEQEKNQMKLLDDENRRKAGNLSNLSNHKT